MPVIGCQCPACLSDNIHDKRLRSAILIEDDGCVFVMDTGPDFRQQMLSANVRHLDAVIYTHEHRDHIAGLDDIRSFNFLQRRSMDLYGEKKVLQSLRTSFPYIFAENKYPGVPNVLLHEIDEQPFTIGNTIFVPVRMLHADMPVLGYRIRDFAYLVDANYLAPEEKKKLVGVKQMVIGALRKEKHHSHFSLEEALELFSELKPEKGFITHISHQMGLEKEYSDLFPDGISAAYDGLVLEL